MAKRTPWSVEELAVIMNGYFWLLNEERAGNKPNKSALRRKALPQLNGRSAGSYEMKMCNISAACAALGLPWVNGYKPLGHAQKDITAILEAHARRAAA